MAAAAAVGLVAAPPVVDPGDTTQAVFHWWVNNYRDTLTRMLTGLDKRVLLYGGYALNVLMGQRVAPHHDDEYACLMFGTAMIGHPASDIDAKITDAPAVDEEATVESMLLHATGAAPAFVPYTEVQGHQAAAQLFVTSAPFHGTERMVRIADGAAVHEGVHSIVATKYQYFIPGQPPHFQVKVHAILANGTVQGLSEFSPVEGDGGLDVAERIAFFPLEILRNQFFVFLQHLMSRPTDAGAMQKFIKTLTRINAINVALGDMPPMAFPMGGGSYTRRKRRIGSRA